MKHRKNERFYVFYDENDFVKYFGTAKELVRMGYFKTTNSVNEAASKIRKKITKGFVVTMTSEGEIV